MMLSAPQLSGTHKTQLLSDLIHAAVVLAVVISASLLAALQVGLPQDVLGTVYGGAIGYAAGRAGNVTRSVPDNLIPFPGGRRATDHQSHQAATGDA